MDMPTQLKHRCEWRRLMVGPEEFHYLVVKLFVVVLSVTGVDDQVVGVTVFETEEAGDVVDWVAVGLFEAWGGKGHGDDVGGDVGEIEVELVVDCAMFGTGYDLTD